MTVSADLPGFAAVDVTTLDVTDPADLVDLALNRAADLIPTWTPREGNVEVVLLEQFAVIVAALAERVEVVVPQVTMQMLGMSGLARSEGTAATLAVEVTLSDTLGHVVPAGTQVIIGDASAESPLVGTLSEDVTVDSGDSVGAGVIVADAVGVIDGLTTSTPVILLDAVAYVDSIDVTAVTTAGTDAETDDAYLARGSAWLASMTGLLGRAEQYANRALTDARIGRALGVQRWDGVSVTPGSDAGCVHVLLLDVAGAALSGPVEAEVLAALVAAGTAEIDVTVGTPVVTSVPITVTLTLLPGHASATVIAAVEAAITEYVDVLTWPWGEALRVSRLQAACEVVTGVDAATVVAPAADVEPDPYDLLTAGTITVTVP